jgi:hypothetical protein
MPPILSEEDIDSIARRIVALIGERLVTSALPSPALSNPPAEKPKSHVPDRLVYTVNELATELRVSRVTLWRLEVRGLLKSVPGIRHKIYSHAEVQRFLAGARSKW